jgi:HK97 family phage major capsid protein
VLRDPYTQSGSGQILFRARKRVGGAVVKAEAIVKLKCHV